MSNYLYFQIILTLTNPMISHICLFFYVFCFYLLTDFIQFLYVKLMDVSGVFLSLQL